MAGPDLSLITNAPNLTSQMNQQQAISSQLAAQQVDVRQKQNAYATQVMSAAAATGDPMQYAKGKQMLASQGIDVSNWSDDPQVGAQQAAAARMALISPLGMLNSSIQAQRNGIQAAGVNGTMAPTGPPGLNNIIPAATQAAQAPNGTSAPSSFAASPLVTSGATTNLPQNGNAAAPAQGTSNAPPSLNQTIQPAAAAPTTQAQNNSYNDAYNRAVQYVGAQPSTQGMNPKTANEVLQGWQSRLNETIAKDPVFAQAQETAKSDGSDTGKNIADAKNALNVMMSNLPAVANRTNGIIQYAPDASSGAGVNHGGTMTGMYPAFANTSLGQATEPQTATANAMVEKYAAQGAFPEIAAQLKNASMKGNKFLEQLMSSGLSINMQSPSDTKVTQAQQNFTAYIQGLKSTAAQVRTNGGSAPTDQQIDDLATKLSGAAASTSPVPAANGWGIQRVN